MVGRAPPGWRPRHCAGGGGRSRARFGVFVKPVLVTSSWARDSAGLSAPERGENLSGAVRVRREPISLRAGLLSYSSMMCSPPAVPPPTRSTCSGAPVSRYTSCWWWRPPEPREVAEMLGRHGYWHGVAASWRVCPIQRVSEHALSKVWRTTARQTNVGGALECQRSDHPPGDVGR